MPVVGYNREKAVDYALRWALFRNPAYFSFNGLGGDCTNFISQCIYAGAGIMNYTKDVGWYYNSPSDRAAAWTSVEYLHKFLVNNKGNGPFAAETDVSAMKTGDFVQLGTDSGNFYHSLFITQINEEPSIDNIFVCTHTFDALNRPLSSYFFQNIRFIHIEGVRK